MEAELDTVGEPEVERDSDGLIDRVLVVSNDADGLVEEVPEEDSLKVTDTLAEALVDSLTVGEELPLVVTDGELLPLALPLGVTLVDSLTVGEELPLVVTDGELLGDVLSEALREALGDVLGELLGDVLGELLAVSVWHTASRGMCSSARRHITTTNGTPFLTNRPAWTPVLANLLSPGCPPHPCTQQHTVGSTGDCAWDRGWGAGWGAGWGWCRDRAHAPTPTPPLRVEPPSSAAVGTTAALELTSMPYVSRRAIVQ
jgi:hypothetical protein